MINSDIFYSRIALLSMLFLRRMTVIELNYLADPCSYFDKLLHLPYPVMLDSCHPYTTQGRFTIASAAPVAVKEWMADGPKTNDPFTHAKNMLSEYTALIPPYPEIPFTTGAIGYFSYDLARYLTSIPVHTKLDVNLPLAVIGIYDWSIVIDHQLQKTWCLSTLSTQHPRIRHVLQCLQKSTPPTKPFQLTCDFTSNFNKATYEHAFNQLQKHILAGDCYQANLCQRFSATFHGSPWTAYQLLRQQIPAHLLHTYSSAITLFYRYHPNSFCR